MNNIQEFVNWAGSQSRAARMLKMSRQNMHRILHAQQGVTPEIAERIEEVSHGLFKKERVLWPDKSEAA